jgi:membrane protein YqaA with SNARE-associated domain
MMIAALLGGVVALTFCAAIVPVGPVEVYLAMTVTANHLRLPEAAAAAAAAALGQVGGKTAVFRCVRRSTKGASRLARRVRDVRLVRRLHEWDTAHPSRLVALVAASSVTGIPPFTIVAPVAGAGGIHKRTFFLTSVAGRLTRFLLIAVPAAL